MEITEEELEKIINERVKEKEKENEENIKRAIELYNLALEQLYIFIKSNTIKKR